MKKFIYLLCIMFLLTITGCGQQKAVDNINDPAKNPNWNNCGWNTETDATLLNGY